MRLFTLIDFHHFLLAFEIIDTVLDCALRIISLSLDVGFLNIKIF